MIENLRAPLRLLREPLFRLLAINLAIGVAAAALMLGGLLALNPYGLRDLIVADRAPLTAAGLLLFGLIVTFGSVAMGTAIMAIGAGDRHGGKRARAADTDRCADAGYSFVVAAAPHGLPDQPSTVMAGLVPAIHDLNLLPARRGCPRRARA